MIAIINVGITKHRMGRTITGIYNVDFITVWCICDVGQADINP